MNIVRNNFEENFTMRLQTGSGFDILSAKGQPVHATIQFHIAENSARTDGLLAGGPCGTHWRASGGFEQIRGTVVPPDDKLDLLCTVLEYPPGFFEQEAREIPSGLVFHRKRSSLPASIRTRVEAEVRLRMMDVMTLLGAVDDQREAADLPRRNGETPEEMAKALRIKWGLGNAPIECVTKTLEDNGIFVIQFDFGTDKLDGFFLKSEKAVCIALNSNPAFGPDRNRFTLAHELGHVVLHSSRFPTPELEKEADAFASAFLAPGPALNGDLGVALQSLDGLEAVKGKWGLSFAGIMFRAHKCGLLSDAAYRRMYIWLGSMGYRRHEPECGVRREYARAIGELLERARAAGRDLCELLHLTEERLYGRYPSLDLGF